MQTPAAAGLSVRGGGSSATTRATSAHRRPTAVMSGPSTIKHSRTMRGESPYHQPANTKEAMSHLKETEKLRRELDRKETRNVAMTSEMQHLRTLQSTQERELRLIAGTFEKCNNERQRLANECSRSKEYIDRLELQLARLGNMQHLTTQLDDLHKENESVNTRLTEANYIIKTRDERIRVLEKEVEAFERSMQLQNDFEGRSGLGGGKDSLSGTGGADANMRSLYYELGKRQTDAHSLALALAESSSEAASLKENLHSLTIQHADLRTAYDDVREHASTLSHQSVNTQDEMAQLMERLGQMKAMATKFSEQSSKGTRELQEEKHLHLTLKTDATRREQELTSALSAEKKETHRLKARIDSMQNSITHIESARALAEQRLAGEITKNENERGVYADKIRSGNEARKEVVSLKQQVRDLLLGREASAKEHHSTQHAYEKHEMALAHMRFEQDQAKAREEELLKDRENSVKALQQTIDATRTLSEKLSDEKARRTAAEDRAQKAEERASAAENIANSLHRAREHVSGASLDALQKEKAKVQQLEKQLAQLMTATGRSAASSNNAANSGNVATSPKHAFSSDADEHFAAFAPSFGGEDLFVPPLPPARRSAEGIDSTMRDSLTSIGSGGSGSQANSQASSSTAGNVKADLARMRQELNMMEAKRP